MLRPRPIDGAVHYYRKTDRQTWGQTAHDLHKHVETYKRKKHTVSVFQTQQWACAWYLTFLPGWDCGNRAVTSCPCRPQPIGIR